MDHTKFRKTKSQWPNHTKIIFDHESYEIKVVNHESYKLKRRITLT